MTSGSVGASTSASLLQSLLQQIASQTQSKPFPTATSATGLSSSPAPSPSPTVNPVASSNPSPLTVSEVLNGLASIFQNAAVAAYATSNGVKPTPTASSPGAAPSSTVIPAGITINSVLNGVPPPTPVNTPTASSGPWSGSGDIFSMARRAKGHRGHSHEGGDSNESAPPAASSAVPTASSAMPTASSANSAMSITSSVSPASVLATQVAAWLKAAGVQSASTLTTSA